MKIQAPGTSVGIAGYRSMGSAMAGTFIRSKELQKNLPFTFLPGAGKKQPTGNKGCPLPKACRALLPLAISF